MSKTDRAVTRRGLLGTAAKSTRTATATALATATVAAVLAAVLAAVVAGCTGDGADGTWPAAATGPSTVALTPVQRHITDELVSVFENATTEPAYDYVEDLGDGRGLTCGKIGFTTSSTEVRD